ncbi:MAG: pyridoxamine 5'-phosphate oxidase family protein [Clostridia bacterium]|nr:pyridoxamine 5'-phosphate oxidase family protein [Clostridia bacterium]
MRRQERQITDISAIDNILRESKVCRLGIADPAAAAPYVVPVSYGYEWLKGRLRLVFHGACAGRKHNLLRCEPQVGFEVDCCPLLLPGDTACQYGAAYRSVIGAGKVHILAGSDEKHRAVDLLMLCQTGQTPPVEEDALGKTAVYELLAEVFTAKGCW